MKYEDLEQEKEEEGYVSKLSFMNIIKDIGNDIHNNLDDILHLHSSSCDSRESCAESINLSEREEKGSILNSMSQDSNEP